MGVPWTDWWTGAFPLDPPRPLAVPLTVPLAIPRREAPVLTWGPWGGIGGVGVVLDMVKGCLACSLRHAEHLWAGQRGDMLFKHRQEHAEC